MGGIRQGQKIISLSRKAPQRWHLQRTMVTQLVEHERIQTTQAKAKALQFLAFRVLRLAREVNEKKGGAINRLRGILTTKLAVKKLIEQIQPRLQGTNSTQVRVKNVEGRRLGDNSKLAYIEFSGNEIEKYETAVQKERIESGEMHDLKAYNSQLLQEEKQFFQDKLEEQKLKSTSEDLQIDEQFDAGSITEKVRDQKKRQNGYVLKFFEKKLATVERDLWIQNKNKYDPRRYFQIY